MNKQFALAALSYGYFLLPCAIFFIFWYPAYLAAPVLLLLLAAAWRAVRAGLPDGPSATRRALVLAVLLLGVWVCVSGVGGFMFQNADHHLRNALLRDLIRYDWPVLYTGNDGNPALLCYYFLFWLPAAAIDKCAGMGAAQLCLYVWTVVGAALAFGLAFRLLPRASLLALLIPIAFSGVDIIPHFIQHGFAMHPTDHMEWWTRWQYSSLTTCLFWVFNQAVPAWLGTALILQPGTPPAQQLFIVGLVYPFAPFPAIGLCLLLGFWWCAMLLQQNAGCSNATAPTSGAAADGAWRERCRWLFKWDQAALLFIATFALLVGCTSLFFSNTGSGTSLTFFYRFNVIKLLLFFIVEFLVPCFFLLRENHKDPLTLACVFSLLFIPLVQIVSPVDYIMRVSIPALFTLSLLITRYLLRNWKTKQALALALYLCLAACTPATEWLRSFDQTRHGRILANAVSTLAPPTTHQWIANFRTHTFCNSLYWKLASARFPRAITGGKP